MMIRMDDAFKYLEFYNADDHGISSVADILCKQREP